MIMSRHTPARHRAEPTRSARRRMVVISSTSAAAVLLGGTAAFAYWSVTGSGSGSAAAASMAAPTVGDGTVTGPNLYPGLTANGTSSGATLTVKASNSNPFPVTVTVAKDATKSVTGCTTPAVSFNGGSFTLPANASNVERTLPNTVSMGTTASNDCQGQTLSIPLTTASVTN